MKSPPSLSLDRLQKVLAARGVGSRRQCEQLILEGRVEVDREVITELGTKVDPDSDTIRVDGVPLRRKRQHYFAVHKPGGVVSTSRDQWRRTRVIDLVDAKERVFTIGRLDKESSGLILVTNDGGLANRLTHPKYGVEKTYHVTVAGAPKGEVLQKIRRGVVLSDGRVRPKTVTIKKRLKQSTVLEIVLTEGRNREIRRMLARFDHKVLKLHRVAIGPIRLGMLPKAAHRELTRDEVKKLRILGQTDAEKPKRKRAKPKGRPANQPSSKAKRKKSKSSFGDAPKMGAVIGGSTSATKKTKVKRSKKR